MTYNYNPYDHEPQPNSGLNPGLWLGLSIAATVMCCLPLGVVGIIYAAQAMDAHGKGDFVTAAQRIDKAKTWTLWSAIVSVAVVVIGICVNRLG